MWIRCRDKPISEKKIIIVLHHKQILRAHIQVFSEESVKEDDIYIQVILPDGKREKAVDDGGVLGNGFKVSYPHVRHGFGKHERGSLGKIIRLEKKDHCQLHTS